MTSPFCVTVDCDSLVEHHAVWGLAAPSGAEVEAFFIQSLETALAWLQDRPLAATFFVTGAHLTEPVWARLLRIADAGHELANHTFSHPYDLSRLEAPAVRDEIERNHRLIAARGISCTGFRTPGYHLCPLALGALEALGYRYSSSQITGWIYPAAKWISTLAMRLRGRSTHTVRHPISDWWTPKAPYHPDPFAPHGPGGSPVWELPIAASSLGLPTVGPLIHACPFPSLFDTPGNRPWIMNLHLTDFAPEMNGTALAEVDFMVRLPVDRRLAALDRILERARRQDRPFKTLADTVATYI